MIDNYNDLTLGMFSKIDEILQGDGDELTKQLGIISVLSGKSEDELLTMPIADYTKLASKSNFLREPCPAVTPPTRLIIGDLVLVPVKDFTKITTAQYIDFQTFSKDGSKAFPQLLGVLLVPDGHKYNDGYDIVEVARMMSELSFPIAQAYAAFFLTAFLKSTTDSLSYLESKAKKMPKKRKAKMMEQAQQIRQTLHTLGLPV